MEEKDFNPDLVFTPLDKEEINFKYTMHLKKKKRGICYSPGCETIEKITYSNCVFPFMIGLFLNHKGEVVKKLINGYTSPENKEDIRGIVSRLD